MEFYEYITHYKMLRKVDPNLTYDDVRRYEQQVAGQIEKGCRSQFTVECRWLENNRPYFNIYPSMAQVLSKVNFKFQCESIQWPSELKDQPFTIRFAKNNECLCKNELDQPLQSIMCVMSNNVTTTGKKTDFQKGLVIFANFGLNKNIDVPETYWIAFPLPDGEVLENIITTYIAKNDETTPYYHFLDPIIRLVVGLLVLASDPEYCIPDVLSKHKAQYANTKDPKFIDKAKRNGKFGWTIGENLEAVPHIRRPHFAIRHTGAGRSVPKLVPIKGSIVNRQKLSLPQGYQDEL